MTAYATPRGDAPRSMPLQARDAVRFGSRCYGRRLDAPIVGPVDLASPAELTGFDELSTLALPAGVWLVQGVVRIPKFARKLTPNVEAAR